MYVELQSRILSSNNCLQPADMHSLSLFGITWSFLVYNCGNFDSSAVPTTAWHRASIKLRSRRLPGSRQVWHRLKNVFSLLPFNFNETQRFSEPLNHYSVNSSLLSVLTIWQRVRPIESLKLGFSHD